ncbi:hypothetical protein HanIR_Chr09g0426631 [Helianthus annuus]|nr:hypothetical protein HanIR_Chr09g0426631 [Helianthus annuus]
MSINCANIFLIKQILSSLTSLHKSLKSKNHANSLYLDVCFDFLSSVCVFQGINSVMILIISR